MNPLEEIDDINNREIFTTLDELHGFIVMQRDINKLKMEPLGILEKPENQTQDSLVKARKTLITLQDLEKSCEEQADALYSRSIKYVLKYTDVTDEREARTCVDDIIDKIYQLSEPRQLVYKQNDKAIYKPKPTRNQKPVVKKPRYTKEKTDSSPHLFGMSKDEIQAHREASEKQAEIEALKELHDLREENEQNLDLENDTNEIDSL